MNVVSKWFSQQEVQVLNLQHLFGRKIKFLHINSLDKTGCLCFL